MDENRDNNSLRYYLNKDESNDDKVNISCAQCCENMAKE